MTRTVTVELCVDDIEGVRIAREEGADRVELCAALDVGGLTPHMETILAAVEEAPAGGLHVIVRSRPGNFVYSAAEVRQMCADLESIRLATAGARVPVGFVVGALKPDGGVDVGGAVAFREAGGGRPLTFHRAFDGVRDQLAGVDVLRELGYQRILTTGGDESVAQPQVLAALQQRAGQDLHIIASGGVRAVNVVDIMRVSGALEVHMRAPEPSGGTDREQVRAIMFALREAALHE